MIFTDDWFMYDDENVTPVSAEDVLRLSGGGMSVIVYLSSL